MKLILFQRHLKNIWELADSYHQITWGCSHTVRTSHYVTPSCFELLSSALPIETWNLSLYDTDGLVFCLRDFFSKDDLNTIAMG
jgi:hypothetical protein